MRTPVVLLTGFDPDPMTAAPAGPASPHRSPAADGFEPWLGPVREVG